MKAKNDRGLWYKGIFCEVWGGMYDNTSEAFFRGTLPGLSRCLKCDDSACVVVEDEVEEKEIYGLTRSRDKKGDVVGRDYKEYVNCIHAQVAGGFENMWVLILEVYEEDTCDEASGEVLRQG